MQQFKTRIAKHSNSYYVLIPSYYVKAGVIDINKEYHVKLREAKQ